MIREHKHRMIRSVAILALAAGSLTLVACDRDSTASNNDNRTAGQKVAGGADTAGDKTNNAIDKAGNATGKAIDKTAEATRNAGDKISDKTEDMKDSAHNTGDSVADKSRDLSHDVAESARDTKNEVAENAQQAANRVTADADTVTPHAADMQQVLGQVTNAAVMEDGFDDLAERLAETDRDRVNTYISARDKWTEINDVTAAIRQAWQNKYHQDFNMDQPAAIFASDFTTIHETAVPEDSKDSKDNHATGTVNITDGGPSVSLISEFPNRWKIDIDNNTTGQALYTNLVKHLREVRDSSDKWPDNVQDAKRLVAKHVLMGVTGQ